MFKLFKSVLLAMVLVGCATKPKIESCDKMSEKLVKSEKELGYEVAVADMLDQGIFGIFVAKQTESELFVTLYAFAEPKAPNLHALQDKSAFDFIGECYIEEGKEEILLLYKWAKPQKMGGGPI